ncbi:hypothetical protein [Streptomyces sp. NPDC001315]|uniref:hypothetical protein n=1 Tax=Streptomyces sp. NPDC001315 TaxID=3364562 RepID=UPI0036BE47BD
MPVATDLIAQLNPAVPDHAATVRALELIATEAAPRGGLDARPPGRIRIRIRIRRSVT